MRNARYCIIFNLILFLILTFIKNYKFQQRDKNALWKRHVMTDSKEKKTPSAFNMDL